MLNAVNAIVDVMVWMINKVMIIAPIGVFGLMAEAVGTFGFGALMVVFKLFIVYVAAIVIFGFVAYPLMVGLFTKTSAKQFLVAIKKTTSRGAFNCIINGNTTCYNGNR